MDDTTRGWEGGANRGNATTSWATRDNAATSWRDKMIRGQCNKIMRGRGIERQCNSQQAQREGSAMRGRGEVMQQQA